MNEFSFRSEQFAGGGETTLFQAILDIVPTGMEILFPIRQGDIIRDFEYRAQNSKAKLWSGKSLVGEKFLSATKGSKRQFELMVQVMESGVSYQTEFTREITGKSYWFIESYAKYEDSLIVSRQDITLQKLSEQEISYSKEFIEQIADATPDIIYVIDLEARHFIYLNHRSKELLGISEKEAKEKAHDVFFEITHPDDYVKIMEHFTEVGQTADVKTLETEVRMKVRDGSYHLFRFRNNVFRRDEKGKAISVVGITTDIEDQVQARELLLTNENLEQEIELRIKELKESKDQLKADAHFINQIIETTPDIIYIIDLNTRQIIYSNREIIRELGYTRSQLGGMKNPIFDNLHENDLTAMQLHVEKLKTLRTDDKILEIEYRLKNAKGGYNWFLNRSSVFKRNSQGIPVEGIGICKDISIRRKSEDHTKTLMEIMVQAEKLVQMGSWEYRIVNGEFIWSEGMYKIFNMDRKEKPVPSIYLDYSSEEDSARVKQIVEHITRDFEPFEETIVLLPPGQDKKHIRIRATVQKDKNGYPEKMIGVDLDITQEVMAAQQINELYNSSLIKNEDLKILNNEIKMFNMVAAQVYKQTLKQLYTNLEYIVSKDARNLSDSSKANIRKAQSAIQRLNLLTDDINTYFNLYEMDVEFSMVDPNPILQQVMERLQPKLEQARAIVEIVKLPALNSNHVLLEHLFGNLLVNAINSRKMIQPLEIKIKYVRADEMNSVTMAKKDTPYSIISFSDNGIGFSEADAENIFELFWHLKENANHKGSGMALAACRRIMMMHGGFITGEGIPANGSTISCYFPMT